MNKSIVGIIYSIALFSTNLMAQARSGRGEDWYDDYGGDGGYFFYFLVAFWGIFIGAAVLRVIYDAILENYKKWFKSLKETLISFLKILLVISGFMGLYILASYLFVQLDSVTSISLEYVGGFIICLVWLGIIRYVFLGNKSNDEVISFFKTFKGIVVGMFILFLMLAIIFS
jgi:glycerol uptake facilitator-like aquaporin